MHHLILNYIFCLLGIYFRWKCLRIVHEERICELCHFVDFVWRNNCCCTYIWPRCEPHYFWFCSLLLLWQLRFSIIVKCNTWIEQIWKSTSYDLSKFSISIHGPICAYLVLRLSFWDVDTQPNSQVSLGVVDSPPDLVLLLSHFLQEIMLVLKRWNSLIEVRAPRA